MYDYLFLIFGLHILYIYDETLCDYCSILNKLTPEKFDLLKGQLIDSGITSADILKVSFDINHLNVFFPLSISCLFMLFKELQESF